jgi:hypothetical protein
MHFVLQDRQFFFTCGGHAPIAQMKKSVEYVEICGFLFSGCNRRGGKAR